MRTRTRFLTALAAGSLLLAACGAEDAATDDLVDDTAGEEAEEEPAEEDAAEDQEAAPAGDVDLAVADSPLGAHLVDGEGLTLYLFDNDEPGVSNCTDDCLANWPPLTVEADPSWGDDVDGDLVGTIEREDDGSTQVTYDGMPLYYWAADVAPGDVDGQGVNDVWWVVAPDGSAITDQLEDAMDADDNGGGYNY